MKCQDLPFLKDVDKSKTISPSIMRSLMLPLLLFSLCGAISACATQTLAPTTTPPPEITLTASAPPTQTDTPPTPTSPPPSPTPTPRLDPAEVLGIQPSPPSTATVVLAREDGALMLKPLSGEPERVLLDPGFYAVFGDDFLVPLLWPVRLSPDGQWLLAPTPADGTWLVSLDGEIQRQITPELLTATWAPDSRHIVYQGEIGPQTRKQDYEIYVQDVVGEEEPRLLTHLPEKVGYPTWSPGCGDVGDSRIALFTSEAYTSTVWLLDAASGEQRALGQFSPQPMMGTPDMLRWSQACDAVWVGAHYGSRAFPVDGSGPQPLVSGGQAGLLSPDGALRVTTAEAAGGRHARLVISRVSGGASVTTTTYFEQAERMQWTSDGRRILIEDYDGPAYTLWSLDPAVREPEIVAENVNFLGTLETLRHRSTEVAESAATLRLLPEPGATSTWETHDLPALGLRLKAPRGWRFEVQGSDDYWTIVLANFAFEESGSAALGEEHLELEIVRTFRSFTTDATAWFTRTVEAEQPYARAEPATVAGYPAARLRPRVAPVSEELRVRLDDGELWIQRRPLASAHDAVFEQFLEQLSFIEAETVALSDEVPSDVTTWVTHTLPSVAVILPVPPTWKITERQAGASSPLLYSASFQPPLWETPTECGYQCPAIGVAVYHNTVNVPSALEALHAWLAQHATSEPFGANVDDSVAFFGVEQIEKTTLGGQPALSFHHDVMGIRAYTTLTLVDGSVVSLNKTHVGQFEFEPVYTLMQKYVEFN